MRRKLRVAFQWLGAVTLVGGGVMAFVVQERVWFGVIVAGFVIVMAASTTKEGSPYYEQHY